MSKQNRTCVRNSVWCADQIRAPLRQKQWDAALTRPLFRRHRQPVPRTISYELLNDHRTNVLQYLGWVTQTMILCDEPGALRAIQHAADRLTSYCKIGWSLFLWLETCAKRFSSVVDRLQTRVYSTLHVNRA